MFKEHSSIEHIKKLVMFLSLAHGFNRGDKTFMLVTVLTV
jgi:hypothetical protein